MVKYESYYESEHQAKTTLFYQSHNKDSKDGLSWECNFYTGIAAMDAWKRIEKCMYLSWKFEWDEVELKKQDKEGFHGKIIAWIWKTDDYVPISFDFKLTHSGQMIRKRIGTLKDTATCDEDDNHRMFYFDLKFSKNSVSLKSPLAIESLMNPEFRDAVLIVEGEKINVNKNYLSMRSEFFNALFNSNFKEKSMEEIPIEDVKYEDFMRMMNAIHPTNPSYPTDDDVEILLNLADRFIMPAVTSLVEFSLLKSSDLPFGTIIKLADKYRMEKLLEQCIKMIVTLDDLKNVKTVVYYKELSQNAKAKLLDRVMPLI